MHQWYEARSDNATSPASLFFRCDVYKEFKYVWGFLTALACSFGFPASVAILWEMLKTYRRSPLTPNDFLILNLSIVDAMFLTSIPPGVANHFMFMNLAVEVIWSALLALTVCGRPLLMACICLDCYVAVVHPIIYHKRKSLLPRVVMVAVVWILTLATGVTLALYSQLFNTPFPAVGCLIGIVVIIICDGFIIRSISKSDPGRRGIHPQKQRAIQTLTFSLVMTIICYFPAIFTYFLASLLVNNGHVFICAIAYPTTSVFTLGSAVMPLFSLYNIGKLKCIKPACCKM